MIALFIRELRENLKWALLISVFMGFVVYSEMRSASPFFMFQLSRGFTTFFAPAAGLLLGVLQAFFETRPDNWAFVVHRPVSRKAVFAAKCAAGLTLLYSSLGIPCLIAAAWAAQPGHLVMPFQGRMLLPVLADIINSGSFYFAAMVITLRRARWYGSRLLPAGLAFLSSFLISIFIAQFSQALLIMLAVQSLGALAAWEVFSSHGTPDAKLPARFALGAMIFPGALFIGAGLGGFFTSFIPNNQWQYNQVDRDGNIVNFKLTIEGDNHRYEFADTEGHPLPQFEGIDPNDPANADLFLRFTSNLFDQRVLPWPADNFWGLDFRSVSSGAIPLRAVAPPGVRVPFAAVYNVPQQLIQLYDAVAHRPIGTVGPDGFISGDANPNHLFPGTPLHLSSQGSRHVLAFPTQVFWIELDQRRVRPIFTPPVDDPIFSFTEIGPPADPVIVLATTRRLHVLHSDGTESFSAPLPASPQDFAFAPAILPASKHLLFQMHPLEGRIGLHSQLLEYDPNGNLIRQTAFPDPDFRSANKMYGTVAFAAIFPPAARALVSPWLLDAVFDIRAEQFDILFRNVILASAVLSTFLALLIARRYGMTPRLALLWAILSLLLGPAALITMLSLHDRPALERCLACGKNRYIARRLCPHCQATLPPPATDGREIFEPADTLQPV